MMQHKPSVIGAVVRILAAGVLATLALPAAAAPALSAPSTSFTSTPNVAISDNTYVGTFASMTTDAIDASSIPAGHIVTDVTVDVAISHSWIGDLTVKLFSPAGTPLALLERPQGDGTGNNATDSGGDTPAGDSSNLTGAYPIAFSDANVADPESAGLAIGTAQAVCRDDGRCQFFPNPDQALAAGMSEASFAAFDGELARGSWKLGIGDGGGTTEVGTLVSWSITIEHELSRSLSFGEAPDDPIADNTYTGSVPSMTSSVIDATAIPSINVVTNITVGVRISHTWLGDVTIKLLSPSGTALALVERPQGEGAANNATDSGGDTPAGDSSNLSAFYALSFNDVYANDPETMGNDLSTSESVCQHDGRCQFFANPDESLVAGKSVARFANFDGEPASGYWTLAVGDGGSLGEAGTFVSWSITIGHLPPLIACPPSPFSDVADDHPFCEEIKWMKNAAVSTGFDDGTFRPSLPVTRQAMSAFMARLAGATLTACTTPPFTDVTVNHPFCKEIKWMDDAGISTGFDDGTYRPTGAVTRQAMSAFMARLADAPLPLCSAPPFTDVPVSHPFCEEIKWMNEGGISTGFDDGTYRPSTAVTRQAMSAFMQRVSAELP